MKSLLGISVRWALAAAGCSATSTEFVTPQRLERAPVIILAGIDGQYGGSVAGVLSADWPARD